jgi:hypothetical protein
MCVVAEQLPCPINVREAINIALPVEDVSAALVPLDVDDGGSGIARARFGKGCRRIE